MSKNPPTHPIESLQRLREQVMADHASTLASLASLERTLLLHEALQVEKPRIKLLEGERYEDMLKRIGLAPARAPAPAPAPAPVSAAPVRKVGSAKPRKAPSIKPSSTQELEIKRLFFEERWPGGMIAKAMGISNDRVRRIVKTDPRIATHSRNSHVTACSSTIFHLFDAGMRNIDKIIEELQRQGRPALKREAVGNLLRISGRYVRRSRPAH